MVEFEKIATEKLTQSGYLGLHVGCGKNLFDDFINCDIEGGECYLDATKPFNIENNCIDYIYSEHFIEHIKFSQAENFFKESYRVLKPDGVKRLLFPDLRKLIDVALHQPELCELIRQRTVNGIKKEDGSYLMAPKATPLQGECWDSLDDIINNFSQYWGHKYLWSSEHMKKVLLQIGFKQVNIKPYGESDFPVILKDPEKRWGWQWTSVVEAVK